MKRLVTHDLYNITNRIKKVDRHYNIYFDDKKRKFFAYFKNNYSFLIGERLDKTAVDKAYKTHIRRAKEIFFDIKENNETIIKKQQEELSKKAKDTLVDYLSYADKKGYDVDFSCVERTRWF